MLAKLLKKPSVKNKRNKFKRNAIGDSKSFGSNGDVVEIKKEINNFQMGDFPVYYIETTSLILPTIFWRVD